MMIMINLRSGFTPLHIAAHYGNENIALVLLQRGADVNYSAKVSILFLHIVGYQYNIVALHCEGHSSYFLCPGEILLLARVV